MSHQGVQAAISIGATILGAVLGRKTVSVGNIGRATTAARGAGRVLKEREDVARAQETVAAVQQALTALEAELQAELAAPRGAGRARSPRARGRPAEEDRRPGAAVRARLDALLARPHGHADARLDVSTAPAARLATRSPSPGSVPGEAAPAPPRKEQPHMRNRFTMAVLAVLVLVGLVATLSMAAGPKQYQWTGTVTELDAKAKTMVVDKGGETWEFSTEGLKDCQGEEGRQGHGLLRRDREEDRDEVAHRSVGRRRLTSLGRRALLVAATRRPDRSAALALRQEGAGDRALAGDVDDGLPAHAAVEPEVPRRVEETQGEVAGAGCRRARREDRPCAAACRAGGPGRPIARAPAARGRSAPPTGRRPLPGRGAHRRRSTRRSA